MFGLSGSYAACRDANCKYTEHLTMSLRIHMQIYMYICEHQENDNICMIQLLAWHTLCHLNQRKMENKYCQPLMKLHILPPSLNCISTFGLVKFLLFQSLLPLDSSNILKSHLCQNVYSCSNISPLLNVYSNCCEFPT